MSDKKPTDRWRNCMVRSPFLALSICCLVIICTGGCLSSQTINAMGTAGGVAPVAFGNAGGCVGEGYWLAHYDDVIIAVCRSGEALSLVLKKESIEEDEAFSRFNDATGKKIDLRVERRTATMTSIEFDVGLLGSVAFGRLMARQIIFELERSGAFLEGWSPEASH